MFWLAKDAEEAATVSDCFFPVAFIDFILQICFLNSSMDVGSPLHSSVF